MWFTYRALIVCGIGPDVLDEEVIFIAADFMDAAEQIQAKANILNGQVASLEQVE